MKKPIRKKASPKKVLVHKEAVKARKIKVNLNIKVSPDEAKAIRQVAAKYTGGNLTSLVRIATKSFKPSKRDLVRV